MFSFLQVKDMLKLRVLSRRFSKTLCTTIPSFCSSDHRPHYSDPHNCSCTHIFDFMVNTVLQNRHHALIINRISSSSFCNKHEHGKLHEQWIIQSFESFRVDELSLDYKLPSIIRSLPKFLSLKVLKPNMNDSLVNKLPKMKLASLETLHIKSIYVRDGTLDKWISHSFPSLKHLSLQKISNGTPKKYFTIRSSSWEDLAIHDFRWFKPVRIITENLQSLTWVGDVDPETFENFQVTSIPRSLIMKESNWNVLIQLFKAIGSARELHI